MILSVTILTFSITQYLTAITIFCNKQAKDAGKQTHMWVMKDLKYNF